jgi:hypothetical protein
MLARVFEDNTEQLPGGRCYQKGGARLERATYECLPNDIKQHTKTNFKPLKDNGDVIVEYDMIYCKNKQLISLEVKGLNYKTSKCPDRQARLLNQAIRQRDYLISNFSQKYDNIKVVFCLVTGKTNKNIDINFINSLTSNNILVAIGETPNDTVKNALTQLKTLGFFSNLNNNSKTIDIKKMSTDTNKQQFIVGSPDNMNNLMSIMKEKYISYANVILK